MLFDGGTERPWSSPLNQIHDAGTFICAACHLPLFETRRKFDSGTGWPSFFQPIDPARIATRRDFRLLVPRTEYHCARCGGHQGHVFNDGPAADRPALLQQRPGADVRARRRASAAVARISNS